MIQHEHDPRCDQRHTSRQRCNGRMMTPAADRLARLAIEAVAEPREQTAPAAEEPAAEPDPVREAVATIDPPEPTIFVSREWSETAQAVEQTQRPPAAPASRPAQSDPGRTAALIGAGLAIVLLVVLRVARGPNPRPLP